MTDMQPTLKALIILNAIATMAWMIFGNSSWLAFGWYISVGLGLMLFAAVTIFQTKD
jgi:hypothetical protein